MGDKETERNKVAQANTFNLEKSIYCIDFVNIHMWIEATRQANLM